jgi:hypothetical protein
VVTLHPQGHVDEGRHKNRIRLEDLKKLNKRKFFSWKKIMMNFHIIKCIWSTEKTQGATVENSFVRTFSDAHF